MPYFATLVVGVDYQIGAQKFHKGVKQEVEEGIFNYLAENSQFEVNEEWDEAAEEAEESDEDEEEDEEVEEEVVKPKRKRKQRG